MPTFDVIAGFASILGLWFSLWAWVRAKAASKAAQAVREAILLRTLAEELQATCDKLDDLMDLIEHDRFDQARWITREVAAALSELPHRGSPYLSQDDKNALLNQREQAQIVEGRLSAIKDERMTSSAKEKVMRACRNSSDTLRQVLGKIKGDVERGGPR